MSRRITIRERELSALDQLEQAGERRLEPRDAEGRFVVRALFIDGPMGRMVRRDRIDDAFGEGGDERLAIRLGPQRRVHFASSCRTVTVSRDPSTHSSVMVR